MKSTTRFLHFGLGEGRDYVYLATTTFRGLHHGDELKCAHVLPDYYLSKVNSPATSAAPGGARGSAEPCGIAPSRRCPVGPAVAAPRLLRQVPEQPRRQRLLLEGLVDVGLGFPFMHFFTSFNAAAIRKMTSLGLWLLMSPASSMKRAL